MQLFSEIMLYAVIVTAVSFYKHILNEGKLVTR